MKLKLSTLRNTIVIVLVFILGLVSGLRYANTGELIFGIKIPFLRAEVGQSSALSSVIGQIEPPQNVDVDFAVFWEVWQLLERDYLEPEKMDSRTMVNGAISGLTSSIGDPYTVYLPPADNKRSGENLSGSFYGIGIELGYIDQTLAVVAPLEGTPAQEAGLEAGDLILHVKDESKGLDEDTQGWSLTEAVDKIRGEKGSPISLTLFREEQEKPFEVTVKRGEIVIDSVTLDFVEVEDKQVAHLKVSRFGGRTMDEWNQAVEQILAKRNQLAGIVLDLRNNPGGYFNTSIEMASDFIQKGVVVSQKGKYSKKDYSANGEARLRDFETVVLVNKGSASASEIVAGALRDDLGVPLIGEQTFGKGTVQDRKLVSNGGGLHLTVGRWLLPSGAWIHDEGIPVDIQIKQDLETEEDEVLLRAIDEL